jgi:MipA family protein
MPTPHPTARGMPLRRTLLAAAVVLAGLPAWGQDLQTGTVDSFAPPAPLAAEAPQGGPLFGPFTTDLTAAPTAAARISGGVGLGYGPDYFGSDDGSFGFAGTFRFDYLRLPGGLEFGSVGAPGLVSGFGPRGSVRYVGSRKASDNSELRGLDDIDGTLEVGLGVGYDAEFARAFADARYGFFGHESWAGEFGADALLYPNENVIVNIGPRAAWGDGGFMDTYFGVSSDEAAPNSIFDAYDPSSGFYSVGVEIGARYQFSPAWGIEGRLNYDYLIDDAADSPIVDFGSRNQFGGRVLITRSISLGF